MKNVTIAIDEALFDAAKEHPEVKQTSLSAFVAKLLRRELEESPEERTEQLMRALDRVSESATGKWTWNRDEIYDLDLPPEK